MSRPHRVARLDDLWSGEMIACEVDGVPVVLIRLGDEVRAYVDRCAHLGFKLSKGELRGTTLTCSAHHWQYNARTGCGVNPASARLSPLTVTVLDGDVLVETDGVTA